MPKFKEGDLVLDTRGNLGVVLREYKNIVGIFYDVMFSGEIISLPEEELRHKHD